MSQIRSHPHPASSLTEHSRAVFQGMLARSMTSLLEKHSELAAFLCRVIGYCHDILKDTVAFQRHLDNHNYRPEESRHSGGGALIGRLAADFILTHNPKILENHPLRPWLSSIVFAVCAGHHSSLRRIDLDHEHRNAIQHWLKTKSAVSKQLIGMALGAISDEHALEYLVCAVKKAMEDGFNLRQPESKATGNIAFEIYLLSKLLVGCFTTADSESALRQSKGIREPNEFQFSPTKALFTIASLNKPTNGPLDRLRTDFQKAAIANWQISPQTPFILIKAPTGLGKTLAVVRLIEAIHQRYGEAKVFYLAPTTVILNQIADDIFGYNQNNNSLLLHHLETRDQDDSKEEGLAADPEYILKRERRIASLDAGLVVTTYYRMIHWHAGLGKNDCLPLYGLRQSIWVLDECQGLSFFQFQLLAPMFSAISRLCGARYIFMSATPQCPDLWKDAHETFLWTSPPLLQSILSDTQIRGIESNEYVNGRRVVCSRPEIKTIEQLTDAFRVYRRQNPAKSVLILMNLARDAVRLFDMLKGEADYVISNFLRPCDVKRQLKDTSPRLKKGEPIVMIATSIVQSGLDLDFDAGFIELNDLRTFRQGCGRVGRNFRLERGVCDIYAFVLTDFHQRPSWFRQRFRNLIRNDRVDKETSEIYKNIVERSVNCVLSSDKSISDLDVEAIELSTEPDIKQIHRWLADRLLSDPLTGHSFNGMLCDSDDKHGFAFDLFRDFLVDDLADDESASPFLVIMTPDDAEEQTTLQEMIGRTNELDRILKFHPENYFELLRELKSVKNKIYKLIAPFAIRRQDVVENYLKQIPDKKLFYDDFDFILAINPIAYCAEKGGWQIMDDGVAGSRGYSI